MRQMCNRLTRMTSTSKLAPEQQDQKYHEKEPDNDYKETMRDIPASW